MALHHGHPTARYYVPRPRPEDLPPRGTEPATALSPLRTRFIAAIAGIVFLTGVSVACAASLVGGDSRPLPATILVISLVLLVSAVLDAAYLLRRAQRELAQ
jgi:hypothetical protein